MAAHEQNACNQQAQVLFKIVDLIVQALGAPTIGTAERKIMFKNIAVALSATTIVIAAASAAYATPVALGGSNTRGTSSGGMMGHNSHGMMRHGMMMKHHSMKHGMMMKKRSAM